MTEIVMPQLGETVTEGTITRWFKSVGDVVEENDVFFEVSTDKVDSEVPSPATGMVSEIRVSVGETVPVGTVLALLDASEPSIQEAPAPITVTAEQRSGDGFGEGGDGNQGNLAGSTNSSEGDRPSTKGIVLSPIVRKLIGEHRLDVTTISGTGHGGRITRQDVERLIGAGPPGEEPTSRDRRSAPGSSSAPKPSFPSEPTIVEAPTSVLQGGTVPLSRIRQLTGEHMVRSKAISPHVMTAVEVDYEAVESVRRAHGRRFKEAEGTSLTYLPFVSRALVQAIGAFPLINASVGDNELQLHRQINLSIAVDLDFEGLMAPVIRDVGAKRLVAIAREIADLAARARAKRLTADELAGGTFTISNSGPFGTFMVAPVINQPQVAILSTDGVTRKPVVVTDAAGGESIAIHSMGMLVMSWDHRAFDGAYAAAFLRQVKRNLETFDWEAEL